MSTFVRRFRYIDGDVREVTENSPVSPPSSIPALGAYREDRPLVSNAMGCMRHQVPEMRKVIERHGLSGIRVRDDGAVEITSRGDRGRRGLLKVRGVYDRDGGYGDG